jgi:hypothetical protein
LRRSEQSRKDEATKRLRSSPSLHWTCYRRSLNLKKFLQKQPKNRMSSPEMT